MEAGNSKGLPEQVLLEVSKIIEKRKPNLDSGHSNDSQHCFGKFVPGYQTISNEQYPVKTLHYEGGTENESYLLLSVTSTLPGILKAKSVNVQFRRIVCSNKYVDDSFESGTDANLSMEDFSLSDIGAVNMKSPSDKDEHQQIKNDFKDIDSLNETVIFPSGTSNIITAKLVKFIQPVESSHDEADSCILMPTTNYVLLSFSGQQLGDFILNKIEINVSSFEDDNSTII